MEPLHTDMLEQQPGLSGHHVTPWLPGDQRRPWGSGVTSTVKSCTWRRPCLWRMVQGTKCSSFFFSSLFLTSLFLAVWMQNISMWSGQGEGSFRAKGGGSAF